MEDWSLPRWEEPNLFKAQAVKELVDLAEERGIAVKGSKLEASEREENYFIELNNRSVLYAYYEKDPGPLIKAREDALKYDCVLPKIDFDSLGDELEIVETAIREKNWFVLSLKNKEGVLHGKEELCESTMASGGDEGPIEEGFEALTL